MRAGTVTPYPKPVSNPLGFLSVQPLPPWSWGLLRQGGPLLLQPHFLIWGQQPGLRSLPTLPTNLSPPSISTTLPSTRGVPFMSL